MKYSLIVLLMFTDTFSYKWNTTIMNNSKCGCDDKNIVEVSEDGHLIIPWDKRSAITWDCYNGIIPDSLNQHSAVTVVSIIPRELKTYNDSIVMDVFCFFYQDLSGKNSSNISDNLFKHEMKHFDLAEVCTRKLRKELVEYISKNASDTQYFFNKIIKKYHKILIEDADDYDNETDYSKNIAGQQKWNKKIDSLLNVYKDYSNPHIVIKKKW